MEKKQYLKFLQSRGFRFIINPEDETQEIVKEDLSKKEEDLKEEKESSEAPDASKSESLEEKAEKESKESSEKKEEDEDKELEDDSEQIPDLEEEDEIDFDKQAPEPKTLHQARSLRKENMKVKQLYKKLKKDYDSLIEENEKVKAAQEEEKKASLVKEKKTSLIKKYDLSDEDINLFIGEDEEIWENLAKRLSPVQKNKYQSTSISSGNKNDKVDQTDYKELSRKLLKV